MPFASLGLSPILCQPLARLEFRQPTPVQAQAIPIVLSGRDLIARAQTGTGKTAAFGLPMIDRLLVSNPRSRVSRKPRGLVLVPTRELAVQVHRAIAVHGAPVMLRSTAIYGGAPMSAQVRALQQGADIVVATPGRLLDHLGRHTIDLSAVEMLTLDEADRMLDMGFLPALREIVRALPQARQTLLFSATLSKDVIALSAAFTREPSRVDVSDGRVVASTITHCVYPVAENRRSELLTHVLAEAPAAQALVFCRTKRQSNRVGEYLERAGVTSAVIHGNKSQAARSRALRDFKERRVTALVATDLAARGIDIAHLPLVINYELPLVATDYVHRIGRTGRAGASGRAVSFVSAGEQSLLRDIERLLQTPLQQVKLEGFASTQSVSSKPGDRPRGPQRLRGPRHARVEHRRRPVARHTRPVSEGHYQ